LLLLLLLLLLLRRGKVPARSGAKERKPRSAIRSGSRW